MARNVSPTAQRFRAVQKARHSTSYLNHLTSAVSLPSKRGDRVHVIDYGGIISVVPVSHAPIKKAMGMLRDKTSLVKALVESKQEHYALVEVMSW